MPLRPDDIGGLKRKIYVTTLTSKEAQMDHVMMTRMLIVLIVLVVGSWDTYLILTGAEDATVSVVLYESARRWPVISFVAGFLCGHVFWQVYPRSF